jgi:hypothetical protein
MCKHLCLAASVERSSGKGSTLLAFNQIAAQAILASVVAIPAMVSGCHYAPQHRRRFPIPAKHGAWSIPHRHRARG